MYDDRAIAVPSKFSLTCTGACIGAANRFPDKCEADPEGARALNIAASRQLAQASSSRRILLIYISTDYVFAGKAGEAPYEADAVPDPPNFYGQTKLDGERAVLETTKATNLGVILRIPVLYGTAEEPKESAINVLMDMVWKAQDAKTSIAMDDWSQRYPTNTEDVARVCVDVASKYLAASDAQADLPKILQFSSEDRYTKYEICQLFADILGLPMGNIHRNREGQDANTTVQRPYDTHLSSRALKELGISTQTQDFKAWWYVFGQAPWRGKTDFRQEMGGQGSKKMSFNIRSPDRRRAKWAGTWFSGALCKAVHFSAPVTAHEFRT